jgi:hypothetical protein
VIVHTLKESPRGHNPDNSGRIVNGSTMFKTGALVVGMLAAVTCQAHDGTVNAEELELIRKAKVIVIVPQDKVLAGFTESRAGKDYGLIGFAIDVFQTKGMLDKMHEALKPVQQASSDLDFRRDFLAQLKGLGIFDSSRIEVISKAPESKSQRLKLTEAGGEPVVLIDAEYQFAQDTYRTLIVELTMTLWADGKKKPLHTNGISHISVPVNLSQAWDIGPISMPLWARDGARRYRAAYAEGIAGSIDLLGKLMGTTLPPRGSPTETRINYCDLTLKNVQRGFVIEEADERVVLFDDVGMTMRSLPVVPTFAKRQADMRPVKDSAARVYFYRPADSGVYFIEPSVYASGSKLGELPVATYASIDVPPGNYSFRVKYDGDAPSAGIARSQMDQIAPVTLDVQAGNEYFIQFETYKGIRTKNDVLKSLDPAAAREDLQALLPVWWTL